MIGLAVGAVIASGAQSPTAPRSADACPIAGVLVSADSGRPLSRGRVSVHGGTGQSTTTDVDGRFAFCGLPAGQYVLAASRPGFLDVEYGQRRPGVGKGTPFGVVVGQGFAGIVFPLPRAGVITGTIVDTQGEPLFGAEVITTAVAWRGGAWVFQPAGVGRTDDRGVYRIPQLRPGNYLVSVSPPEDALTGGGAVITASASGGPVAASASRSIAVVSEPSVSQPGNDAPEGYAPVFYPGATTASSATPIALGAGEERSGIDIRLQLLPLTRLSGVVIGPDNQTPPGVEIGLLEAGPATTAVRSRTTQPNADGQFFFSGVAPGQYTVWARQQGGVVAISALRSAPRDAASSRALWAHTDLVVDGRTPSTVVLPLQPGINVSGTVVFEGVTAAPRDQAGLQLSLVPAGAGSPLATEASAVVIGEQFTFEGVLPGSYRVVANAPAGWTLKSAVVDGRDALDVPAEVRPGASSATARVMFSDRRTELSGIIQDPSGKPGTVYTVILFPVESQYWTAGSRRIQAGRPATDGRFTFHDLPAGTYRLGAVVDAEPDEWFDPAFLTQLTASTIVVTLAEGESRVQNLRAAGR